LEAQLDAQLRSVGFTQYEKQAGLVPGRRFRHDFYFPAIRTAVEVQGGIWTAGRHSRGAGMEADFEKCALARLQGVSTVFVSGRHVRSGQALAWILALHGASCGPKTSGGAVCE
jgi:hypothetical protein